MERRKPDLDLAEICRQATALIQDTLGSRAPRSARPLPHVALATVPTPELATGDQRHELGLAAVEQVDQMLGRGAAHSVSHTRAVSVVVGTVGPYLGIDIERLAPERPRIAPRILTSGELEELGAAPKWLDVLRCFCLKEATYKVLDDMEQQGLRFRGLRLEDVKLITSRVHLADAGQCVARAAAALGTEVLVALATPWIVGIAATEP